MDTEQLHGDGARPPGTRHPWRPLHRRLVIASHWLTSADFDHQPVTGRSQSPASAMCRRARSKASTSHDQVRRSRTTVVTASAVDITRWGARQAAGCATGQVRVSRREARTSGRPETAICLSRSRRPQALLRNPLLGERRTRRPGPRRARCCNRLIAHQGCLRFETALQSTSHLLAVRVLEFDQESVALVMGAPGDVKDRRDGNRLNRWKDRVGHPVPGSSADVQLAALHRRMPRHLTNHRSASRLVHGIGGGPLKP
jgi:hypothetical protein